MENYFLSLVSVLAVCVPAMAVSVPCLQKVPDQFWVNQDTQEALLVYKTTAVTSSDVCKNSFSPNGSNEKINKNIKELKKINDRESVSAQEYFKKTGQDSSKWKAFSIQDVANGSAGTILAPRVLGWDFNVQFIHSSPTTKETSKTFYEYIIKKDLGLSVKDMYKPEQDRSDFSSIGNTPFIKWLNAGCRDSFALKPDGTAIQIPCKRSDAAMDNNTDVTDLQDYAENKWSAKILSYDQVKNKLIVKGCLQYNWNKNKQKFVFRVKPLTQSTGPQETQCDLNSVPRTFVSFPNKTDA